MILPPKSSYILISLFFILSACGGGGGSNDTGQVSAEISQARFNEVIVQSGAGILTYSADINLQESLPAPNQNILAALSVQFDSTFGFNLNDIGNNQINVCGEISTIETDLLTFSNGDDLLDFFSTIDSTELETEFCSDFNVRYFSSNNSSASAEFFCEDTRVATINYQQVSNNPNTSFGSLSISSNQIPNLNSDNVECASLFYTASNVEYSPQPNQLDLTENSTAFDSLSIDVPYGDSGNFLEFFIFFDEPLITGTYDLSDIGSFVSLTSNEFGMTNGDPNEIFAESGTVIISSVSADTITGSYDIVTEDNAALTGSFSVDLN